MNEVWNLAVSLVDDLLERVEQFIFVEQILSFNFWLAYGFKLASQILNLRCLHLNYLFKIQHQVSRICRFQFDGEVLKFLESLNEMSCWLAMVVGLQSSHVF